MKIFIKYKFEIYLLLFSSFFATLVSYLIQINYQDFVFPDSYSYILASKELFLDVKLNDHRPLVISFINGLPLLFGFSEKSLFTWSLIVNYICWLGTILLIFNITKEILNNRKSFFVAFFYILCIGNLIIVFHLLNETIFIFLLSLILYYLFLFKKKNNITFLVYAISILILMTMIKPLSIGLIFILLLLYFKYLKKIILNKSSVLIYLSLFVLAVQLIGMKKEFGNYTISYIDAKTYYNYLGTRADCLKNKTIYEQGKNERVIKLKDKSLMEIKLIANEDFKEQLNNNKTNLLKAYLINIYTNSIKGTTSLHYFINIQKTSYFEIFSFLFKSISKLQNIFFTIFAILLSVRFIFLKSSKPIKFISTTILALILISAISSDQGDRFHIIFYPLLLILFAEFLNRKTTKSKRIEELGKN